MDRLSKERRSYLMSRIRSTDTGPEIAVRKIAHRLGYRFRLHRANLPGRPDIVFPCKSAVVFVHGCFWHGHFCKRTKMPKSRTDFWNEKINRNRYRDIAIRQHLRRLGWRVMVVWECALRHPDKVERMLLEFLGPTGRIPTNPIPRHKPSCR